jgi:hypothetical protein
VKSAFVDPVSLSRRLRSAKYKETPQGNHLTEDTDMEGTGQNNTFEDKILAEIVRRLIEAYRPERIYLFGSTGHAVRC